MGQIHPPWGRQGTLPMNAAHVPSLGLWILAILLRAVTRSVPLNIFSYLAISLERPQLHLLQLSDHDLKKTQAHFRSQNSIETLFLTVEDSNILTASLWGIISGDIFQECYSLCPRVFDFYRSILRWDTKVDLGFEVSPKPESTSISLRFLDSKLGAWSQTMTCLVWCDTQLVSWKGSRSLIISLLFMAPQGLSETFLDGPGSTQDTAVATAALHNVAAPHALCFLA